jgi:hypothetical protein
MDVAEQLGYEVKVYARVPDTGEGADRVRKRHGSADLSQGQNPYSPWKRGKAHRGSGDYSYLPSQSSSKPIAINGLSSTTPRHAHKRSSGGGTSESDHGRSGSGPGSGSQSQKSAGHMPTRPGLLAKPRRGSMSQVGPTVASLGHSLPTVTTLNSLHAATATSQNASAPRVKYREQGVDELLQLKLLQAIAEADPPPPNATIVLATGDGNVGEFNEEGFIGCVRTALKKGWKVELYAWEDGLSQAWMREFGAYAHGKNGSGSKSQFRIIGMQQFAPDLLDV